MPARDALAKQTQRFLDHLAVERGLPPPTAAAPDARRGEVVPGDLDRSCAVLGACLPPVLAPRGPSLPRPDRGGDPAEAAEGTPQAAVRRRRGAAAGAARPLGCGTARPGSAGDAVRGGAPRLGAGRARRGRRGPARGEGPGPRGGWGPTAATGTCTGVASVCSARGGRNGTCRSAATGATRSVRTSRACGRIWSGHDRAPRASRTAPTA